MMGECRSWTRSTSNVTKPPETLHLFLGVVSVEPAFTLLASTADGFVTSSNEERDKGAARVFSSGRDRRAPRVHRRGAEGAVRLSRGEAALNVEEVVEGGVSGEKLLR